MEVKQGYKQTEVGLISEDWTVKRLEEVADIHSGGTPSTSQSHFWDGDILWCTPTDITALKGRKYLNDTARKITLQGLKSSSADLIPVNSLVMTSRATIGECAINQLPVSTNQGFKNFIPNKGTNTEFLYYLLQTKKQGFIRLCGGSTFLEIGKSQLNNFLVQWPSSKAEQEAIAEALSDADALIVSLEQLIQKKRLIKQGAMQELLRPKDGWVAMKLGRLGSFLKGSGVRREVAVSGDIPCVRYGEIYTRHNDFIKVFDSWISPEVALTAKPMKTGDMLFAGSGETKEDIGKCVAFLDDFEAYAGGDIIILRPENVNSRFLGYYLNSESINRQKASKGQGDAVVHITANALADVDLMMPSVDEQFAIASVLSDMDAELSSLEEKLMKVRHLKNGMMRNLLTGKIRLVIGSKF